MRHALSTLLLAAGLGFSGCVQAGGNDTDVIQLASNAPAGDCPVMMTFSSESAVAPWRAVNDGVMGGRSSGGPDFAADAQALAFSGMINTNGGGFSSIRLPLTPGQLSGSDGLKMKVRSDGRAYKMSFRTSQSWRGRSVSWQIPIPATQPGEWAEVEVPFARAEASIFGRPVRAGTFDPTDAREMGIIIADGRDGPFRLDVAWIDCAGMPAAQDA